MKMENQSCVVKQPEGLSLSLVRANCSPVQGFGSRRRGVEVCGCGVVAAVTLILLVCCTVYVKVVNTNYYYNNKE